VPAQSPPDTPRDLRRRILRLPGLPLRPATARLVLDRSVPAESPPATADDRLPALDPGWIVARWRSRGTGSNDLAIIAEADWWCPATGASDAARERLWRYSVATARAVERLAEARPDLDAAELGRLGMLSGLGHWALASVAPDRLAQSLAIEEPAERRAFERSILGTELATLGRDLADRWDLPAPLAEANWLAGLPAAGWFRPTDPAESETLALLGTALDWAGRTPWTLSGRPPEPPPPDPRLRLLVAEVQVYCGNRFVAPDATPREMALTRAHARILRDQAHRESEQALLAEFVEALSGWVPGDTPEAVEGGPVKARLAWRRAIDDRDRLAFRLDSLEEAYRVQAESDATSRAAERLEALAEFAAGAAHELNNPLAVILGRAQLLLPNAADDAAARSLRAIISQAQRAHRILRDLMYIARPPEPRPRATMLPELLRNAVRDLSGEAESRGVSLEVEIGEPLGLIRVDADSVRHAVDVLVRNAIEATPSGGNVRLRVSTDSSRLEIVVRDDGSGLDAHTTRHLLDPFYCGRQAGRGLGLGLPRVARWVARFGGTLRWGAAPGKGTSFHLTLPLAEAPSHGAASGNDRSVAPHLPRTREVLPSVQAIS
jgi:signal transduction histidine kinase